MNRSTIIFPLAVLLLPACFEEDTTTNDDEDSENQTIGDDTEAFGDTFEPDSVEAFFYSGNNPVWVLTAKQSETWLSIENYPSFGGASDAETRTLDDTEVNYATCGVCVLLKTGCQQHGDHGHCSATYMPEEGATISFDQLDDEAGGNWSGSLSSIVFVEVSIDGDTYETTPIEDGDTIELDSWDFDVILEAG